METPSSTTRITRSQVGSASCKNKHHETSSRSHISGNKDRAVFQDITNDSPINGVAREKSPLSSAIKNGARPMKTPGSGEALLRGQVKILLEKVEEGAELINNKLSNRQSLPFFPGFGILPHILTNKQAKDEAGDAVAASVVKVNLVAESVDNEKSAEFQECVLNRDQLVDFFKSPYESKASDMLSTVSSSVTYQGSVVCSSYDDNWSVQATASVCTEDDEEECDENTDDEKEDEVDEEEENGGENEEECLDELCEGMKKITVEDKEAKLPEFTGKHTRFIYNSDDEIEGKEEIDAGKVPHSPSVLVLKGLPVPEGKHLRFHEDEDEE